MVFLLALDNQLVIRFTGKQKGAIMASTLLTRVTGVALAYNRREGTIKRGERAGEPFVIETANVLVASQNVTVVQLPRRDKFGEFESLSAGAPSAGEFVDYLVEVSIYGQDVQARVLSDFPAEHAELATSSLAA